MASEFLLRGGACHFKKSFSLSVTWFQRQCHIDYILFAVTAAAHFFICQPFPGYTAVETTPYLSGLQESSNSCYVSKPTLGQRKLLACDSAQVSCLHSGFQAKGIALSWQR